MDDLTHNAWATPDDVARQRAEQAKRLEALAREAAQAQNQRPQQKPPPPPPPPQFAGPSWGSSSDQPAYRAYGADQSDKFAEWERKEELKAHRIELFAGKSDFEGLQKWFRSVEHYGRLAGYSEQRVIEKAWKFFTAEVLDWFTLMLRREYGVSDFPPPRYPFGWHELKARMEAAYASPFSINYVWRDLANLKRGWDVVAFHSRFTELARLVGETPDSALYGSRLWDIYYEKMSAPEQHTLSSVIHMARQLGRKPCLRDAMAVLDEDNLKHGGTQAAANPPTSPSCTSLDPGPVELGATAVSSQSDQCRRCMGYGHWPPACGNPRDWKRGDPIAGRAAGEGGSSGSGSNSSGSSSSGSSSSGSSSRKATVEVSFSEASETSGNLLRFNLPIIAPSRSPTHRTALTAYTLWDCGGSHKFVHPDLVAKLRAAGGIIKTRNRGSMDLTTAGRRDRMPLREAPLSLDIGGYRYRGWSVLYTLAKYDIILGESWRKKSRTDLNRNILWLGEFTYRLAGLLRGMGRQGCQAHACSADTSAKPETPQSLIPSAASSPRLLSSWLP